MSTTGGGGDAERFEARTSLENRTMASEVRPAGLRTTVNRTDRIRWGPVWAGTVVAVATYLLLEMALLGADLLDADVGGTAGAAQHPGQDRDRRQSVRVEMAQEEGAPARTEALEGRSEGGAEVGRALGVQVGHAP